MEITHQKPFICIYYVAYGRNST